MSRPVGEWIFPAAPAGDQLQPGIQHARQQAVLESLVKIADAVQFLAGPTGQEFVLIGTQRSLAEVVFEQSARSSVSAASIPDFMARWMPFSRWEFSRLALSPISRPPSK